MPRSPQDLKMSAVAECCLLTKLTVNHCKIDIKHSDQLWVSKNDLSDAFASKRLFSEPRLDLVEHFGMVGIAVIEDVFQ